MVLRKNRVLRKILCASKSLRLKEELDCACEDTRVRVGALADENDGISILHLTQRSADTIELSHGRTASSVRIGSTARTEGKHVLFGFIEIGAVRQGDG